MNDHIVNPLRPGQDLPDVYKQKQNQAEDDLSRDTVRNGLEYRMTEHTSEHESLLLQSTFNYNNIGPVLINMMQSTINNKLYASVFNDQNRPKKFAALVKDLFWPAARNLNLSSVWFSELSKLPQSTKINRKVPTFLQKQHILINLFNSNVCPIRSVWYIKMHAAFQFYCLEQKSKKRQTYDAGVDWTKEWVEILKDILNSDARFIDGNSADIPISVSSNDWHSESSVSALLLMELAYTTTSGYSQQMHLAQLPRDQAPITSFVNVQTAINELQRFWQFTSAITFELINQRLVDSYVVFESLMHFLEIPNGQQLNRLRTVKIMHFILKVLPRFTESEILSRRLSVFCSKTISALQDQIHKCVSRSRLILTHDSLTPTSSSSNMSPQTNSSVHITSNDLTVCSPSSVSSPNVAPLSSQAAASSKDTNKSCFLINDLHLFSSVLQLILIKCPQSQVWSKPPSSVEGTLANKDGSSFLLEKQKALLGSSLDLVKFQPSDLALDSNLLSTKQSHLIRKHLRVFENNIKQRSMMVERKWTSDNFDENVDYSLIHMLISIYDVLIIDEISSTGEAIEVQIDQSFAQTLSSHVFLNFSINAKMIVIKHLFDLCLCADADFSQRRNFLCAALLKKLLYSAKTLSSDMFDSVNCCILVVLRDLIVDLSLKILNSVKDCDLNDLRILYKKPEIVKLLLFCAILLYMDVVNYTSLIWKILNTKHICSSYIWNADHFTNRCTLQTESFVQDSHSSIKSNFDSPVNSSHHEELSRLILFMIRSIPLTFYGLRPNTLPCYRNYTLFSFKNGRHIFDTRIKKIEMHRRAVVKMLFSRICTTICCSCASCDACYHGRTFDFESWWLQFDKFHIGLYLFDCFQTISSLLYRILRYLCEHPTPWDSCVCDYFYKQQHNDSALLRENDPVDFDTKKSSLSTSYCDFLEERNLRIKQLTNFLTELGAVYEYSNVNYLFFKFAVQFLMLSVSRICGKDVSKNYIPPPTKIKIDNSLEECNKLWLDLINFSVRYLHEHLDVLLFDPSGVMLVDIAECILHYLASETDVCNISLVDFLIELYANSFAVKNFIVTNKFDLFTGILTKHSFRCIDIKSNCLFLQLQKNSNFADTRFEPTTCISNMSECLTLLDDLFSKAKLEEISRIDEFVNRFALLKFCRFHHPTVVIKKVEALLSKNDDLFYEWDRECRFIESLMNNQIISLNCILALLINILTKKICDIETSAEFDSLEILSNSSIYYGVTSILNFLQTFSKSVFHRSSSWPMLCFNNNQFPFLFALERLRTENRSKVPIHKCCLPFIFELVRILLNIGGIFDRLNSESQSQLPNGYKIIQQTVNIVDDLLQKSSWLESLCVYDYRSTALIFGQRNYSEQQSIFLLSTIAMKTNAPIKLLLCDDLKSLIPMILKNFNGLQVKCTLVLLSVIMVQREQRGQPMDQLLDLIAKSMIEKFKIDIASLDNLDIRMTNCIWLVTLIANKLHPSLRMKLIKHASSVLDNIKPPNKEYTSLSNLNTGRNVYEPPWQSPYLILFLSCLGIEGDQKENFLSYLKCHFDRYIELEDLQKPDRDDDDRLIVSGLQFRLKLLGTVFDSVMRNTTTITEWCTLLGKILSNNVFDRRSSPHVYETMVDMYSALVRASLLINDGRMYMSLCKKIRKEVFIDSNVCYLRKFREIAMMLPVWNNHTEIKCTEIVLPAKTSRLDITMPCMEVATHQESLNVWDLVEGINGTSVISLSWFAAYKLDHLRNQIMEAFKSYYGHTHNTTTMSSMLAFLEKPNTSSICSLIAQLPDRYENATGTTGLDRLKSNATPLRTTSGATSKSKSSTDRKKSGLSSTSITGGNISLGGTTSNRKRRHNRGSAASTTQQSVGPCSTLSTSHHLSQNRNPIHLQRIMSSDNSAAALTMHTNSGDAANNRMDWLSAYYGGRNHHQINSNMNTHQIDHQMYMNPHSRLLQQHHQHIPHSMYNTQDQQRLVRSSRHIPISIAAGGQHSVILPNNELISGAVQQPQINFYNEQHHQTGGSSSFILNDQQQHPHIAGDLRYATRMVHPSGVIVGSNNPCASQLMSSNERIQSLRNDFHSQQANIQQPPLKRRIEAAESQQHAIIRDACQQKVASSQSSSASLFVMGNPVYQHAIANQNRPGSVTNQQASNSAGLTLLGYNCAAHPQQQHQPRACEGNQYQPSHSLIHHRMNLNPATVDSFSLEHQPEMQRQYADNMRVICPGSRNTLTQHHEISASGDKFKFNTAVSADNYSQQMTMNQLNDSSGKYGQNVIVSSANVMQQQHPYLSSCDGRYNNSQLWTTPKHSNQLDSIDSFALSNESGRISLPLDNLPNHLIPSGTNFSQDQQITAVSQHSTTVIGNSSFPSNSDQNDMMLQQHQRTMWP